MDDLRAALLAAFEVELAEHLSAVRFALGDAAAGRPVDIKDASRRAHSLKGAARAVEQPETEALAHQAEEWLLAVEAGERPFDAALIADLRALFDRIEDSASGKAADAPVVEPAAAERLRVDVAHLERLSRALGELSVETRDGAGLDEALGDVQAELIALVRLAEGGRTGEVARRLSRVTQEVGRLRSYEARRRERLDRATMTIEHDAERMLLSPVDSLFDGHERMVREIAVDEGKQATLVVERGKAEADRRVLAALREPVLHMLRNAVDHGIETPDARTKAGKPETAEVHASAWVEAGRLTLTITDDGRGLDYDVIHARARAAGLVATDAPRPRDADLRALIFAQGFSTAAAVGRLSGRGIGLSVVAEAARRLHGWVQIAPTAQGGTRITLSVPAALTRQSLLFAEAAGEVYGIPASAVAQMRRIERAAIERSEGADLVMIDCDAVPLVSLAGLVGRAGEVADAERYPALILKSGDERRAVIVDALLDVRAVILGDPTAIAADAPLVYGTALYDGSLAIVLSPAALIATGSAQPLAARFVAKAAVERVQRTILVVDDSITTRTLEKTILEGQGYRVLVDVDGLAGLERLRSGLERIDLVVADVEMPRMDGFALLSAIRNDPALKSLPVVMMTSRNSPDDVERGLSLGADAYVTKQEFDQGTLISVVQQLI